MFSPSQIAVKVQDHIKGFSLPRGISSLQVLKDGIRSEDDHWFVPVQPPREPANTTQYYETLARIETALLEDDDVNVLLIPVAPAQKKTSQPK